MSIGIRFKVYCRIVESVLHDYIPFLKWKAKYFQFTSSTVVNSGLVILQLFSKITDFSVTYLTLHYDYHSLYIQHISHFLQIEVTDSPALTLTTSSGTILISL